MDFILMSVLSIRKDLVLPQGVVSEYNGTTCRMRRARIIRLEETSFCVLDMGYKTISPIAISCCQLKQCEFGRLSVNPLNAELNLICYLLALLVAHHFLHVSRIRVKFINL